MNNIDKQLEEFINEYTIKGVPFWCYEFNIRQNNNNRFMISSVITDVKNIGFNTIYSIIKWGPECTGCFFIISNEGKIYRSRDLPYVQHMVDTEKRILDLSKTMGLFDIIRVLSI